MPVYGRGDAAFETLTMAESVQGKVVVITGGSSGIGRATALEFAKQGAHLVIAARRAERLAEVCVKIESLGSECLAVTTDVADRAQIQRLLESALDRFGRVDIWINNAGFGLSGSAEETTPDEMMRLWHVNFQGVFDGSQIALKQMRAQGSGHVMNVSSMAALYPLPMNAAYTATKCAIFGFTDALSMELEGSGIHATTILPSLTNTEFPKAAIRKHAGGETKPPIIDSPEKVARRIVQCARKPRPVLLFGPVPRLALAFHALVPGFWRALMRKYIASQTGGKGVQPPK